MFGQYPTQQFQGTTGYNFLPNSTFAYQPEDFNQPDDYTYLSMSYPTQTLAQPAQLVAPSAWLGISSFPPLSDLALSADDASITGGESSYQQAINTGHPAISSAGSFNTHGQSIFHGASVLLKSS